MNIPVHIDQIPIERQIGFDRITAVDPQNPAFYSSLHNGSAHAGPMPVEGAYLIRIKEVMIDSTNPSHVEKWGKIVEASSRFMLLDTER